ncbi:MAG TPA: bifunctional riboflavin kinase/FAD synthetase [Blastocatellia bacterium]|nr:bifunctional riboflavin kinase/FAD synthetase [Blastocatellia bacterium]
MIVVRRTDDPQIVRPTTVTLGVFDGLHLGHQAIMRTVVARAAATGTVPTVVTFDPHPRSILHPESAPPLLQTFEQRLEGMRFLGIEQVVALEFTRELASIPAEEFVTTHLVERLDARSILLGKGFAFGRGRGGNIELLRSLSDSHGFVADEVAEVELRGQRISSTAARRALSVGRVNLARRMLGRPYGLEGRVIEGRKLGREVLGFPTANIQPHNRVLPGPGVYVTATLTGGVWHRSVTNVGFRPTVGADDLVTVEAHILDFDRSLYGETIRVRFLHRVRSERQFPSLDVLRQQIGLDVVRAARYFRHPLVRRNLAFV